MPPEPGLCFAASFAPALLDPARSTPELVTGPNGKAAGRRYDVHRNNVTVSLIDALAAIYPAVQRITGVDFFRAMARLHVRSNRLLRTCKRAIARKKSTPVMRCTAG